MIINNVIRNRIWGLCLLFLGLIVGVSFKTTIHQAPAQVAWVMTARPVEYEKIYGFISNCIETHGIYHAERDFTLCVKFLDTEVAISRAVEEAKRRKLDTNQPPKEEP